MNESEIANWQTGIEISAGRLALTRKIAFALNGKDVEIERLRVALYDAREYLEHQVKTTGTVWAQDRLNKIDAALGNQQRSDTGI